MLVSAALKHRRRKSLSRWRGIVCRFVACSLLAGAVAMRGQPAQCAIVLQTVDHTMDVNFGVGQDACLCSTSTYSFSTNGNAPTNVSLTLTQWGMAPGDVAWGEQLTGNATGGGLVGVAAPLALVNDAAMGLAATQLIAYRSGAISISNSGSDAIYLPKSQYYGDSNGDVYVGLKFHLTDGDHFGWARLTIDNNAAYGVDAGGVTPLFFTVTIDQFAYEGVVGEPIHAGTATSLLPGDANGDGTVNGADLGAVLSNFNKQFSGDAWTDGDFDANGWVNGADLGAVLSNFNKSVRFDLVNAAVPEPYALVIWTLGLLSVLAWKKGGRGRASDE